MEVLQTYGEKCILRRVWTLADYEAGRVEPCLVCHAGATTQEQEWIADTYEGAGQSYCPACFGVRYTGGFEPIVYITYLLSEDEQSNWERDARGTMQPATPRTEFPWTPALDEGDLVVRVKQWSDVDPDVPLVERGRYTTKEIETVDIRTGPAAPDSMMYVAQATTLAALPQQHPYLGVPIS